MADFALKEQAVASFETALRNAGMQDAHGTETGKSRFYRGVVSNIDDSLYLNYVCTDNSEVNAADNKSVRRCVYLNGALYSRNGYADEDYQDLAEAIETECGKLGIYINFSSDGEATPVDTESSIYYCEFEAQKIINKENRNG